MASSPYRAQIPAQRRPCSTQPSRFGPPSLSPRSSKQLGPDEGGERGAEGLDRVPRVEAGILTDRGGGGGLTTAPKKGSNGADGEEAKTACRRSDRTRDTDRDPVGIGAIPNAVAPRRRRIWRG